MELSILIPSRNEEFLAKTIEDILKNKEADTEIIVVLDGEWADPPVPQYPDVNIVYLPEAIGQRAATNVAAKLARGKYVMKIDAHCAFDKGFDRKMIDGFKKMGDNNTMVPIMRNLWAFDWVCKCGERKYQDKGEICDKCGSKMIKDIKWIGKHNPQSTSYCFDAKPQFTYFEDYKHREPYLTDKKTGFTESMSLQGSCFMATRKNYWDYELCDEKLGNWGNQGIEVACKTWLSGGKVLVNHNTWYAHLFRTKPEVFGFPWPYSGRDQHNVKKRVRDLFWKNEWSKQIHPISWLVEKFWPVKGWTENDLNNLKGKSP